MAKKRQVRENYKLLIPAKENRKSGVYDRAEKIIDAHVMRAAEKVFWKKRGLDFPPGSTIGGVMR